MASSTFIPGLAGALALAALSGCAAPIPTGTVTVVDERTIEFHATVAADAFAEGDMASYHLVVWEGGGAADHSLFVADVSDLQVIDALEQIGARPGDALAIDSWDDRYEADASAPDQVIEGPPVVIEVVLPDGTVARLDDLLIDDGGRGFDMRFGGHRDNIPEWHSGCVVCLYSCPGSKVGNARYTVRDFVAGATHFRANPELLPADGTPVTLRFRLGDASS